MRDWEDSSTSGEDRSTTGLQFAVEETDPTVSVGIDPDEIAYVFELFTRGQHANLTDGTGAGQAMCKKIVEQHGGSIGIESTLGERTKVMIRLPKRG